MTVVVLSPPNADWLDEVREAAGSASLEFAETIDDVRTAPAEVSAIVGLTDPVPIARYPNLRWLHSSAAGVDGHLTPEVRGSDVVLTSSAGNGGIPLAEHALMLMLMLGRDALRWLQAQREHRWDRFRHAELAGRTVVIVGMGAAGRHLATLAQACQMRVVAVTRTQNDPIDCVDLAVRADSLADVAADCDFLVVLAPLTPTTRGLVGEDVLQAMPDHAAVVCVSRGGIVDEQALIAALREGRLAGAGLDALAVEPLPPSSPLWDMPNVIITPHNAATTDGTVRRGRDVLIDNLRRHCRGDLLRNVVDKHAGY